MKKIYPLLCCMLLCLSANTFSQTILNESFDDTSFVPAGWYKAKIFPTNFPANGQWDRVTTGITPPHSGAGMARFNSATAGNGTISELGTSVLNLSAGAAYRVRCWIYRGDNAPFQTDRLEIYINTQQNITGAFKLGTVFIARVKSPAEAVNGWYEYVYDLPASFNSSTNYIIFRATGNISNVVYLDDVVVETYACNQPVGPSVTNVLTTSASLNWNAPAAGAPSEYDWEVRTNGSAGSGAAGLAAAGTNPAAVTTATATGLTKGITHYFYVRSSCGTEKGTWTNAVAFNTKCDPATIPYIENFDGVSNGVPACTFVENINGGDAFTSSLPMFGSTYSKSVPNALLCYPGGTGSSGAQNDWFYTAALSLEAGKCYQLSFAYRTSYSSFIQSLKVNVGTAQSAAAMTNGELYNNAAIQNDSYLTALSGFSVAATGVYFIGFNYYGAVGNGAVLIDDISVTETVSAPTGINASPIGAGTAQLNWTAPSCGNATAYDWELRTSGAAGSGATGLISSGNGAGLNNTFSGLTENKAYTFYIRSKNISLTGAWSGAYTFQTNCSIRPLPYTENFDGVIAPALPSCTIKQNLVAPYNAWNAWLNVSYERPNSAPNSMRCGSNNSTLAGDNWFFSPPFNFTAGKSYRLNFYYRNDIYAMSEKLEVKYGTGANAAAMISPALFSNTDVRNSLFKKAVIDFVPAQNGTYNIGFHYFSDWGKNFVYVDDIKVEETPACDVVKDINARLITLSSATLKWQAPQSGVPDGYDWEVRTTGGAGSGTTGMVASGTLASGALSVPLSGLHAGTTCTFYIRSNCGAQTSEWVPYTFTTACNAVIVPYTENFDGVTAPALPPCTKIEEVSDHYQWNNTTGISRSAPNSLYHRYTYQSPFDDWFFTAPLQLKNGKTYRLSFYYRQEASGYSDAIEIKLGHYAQGDSMNLATIYTNTNVSSTAYQLATATFTVPATGVYYLGLHSITGSYSRGIAVDDISVNEMSPDLIIINQSLSASKAATSDTITANFTLVNQGLTSAAPHKTYFYLSADSILTPGTNGDILLGYYNMGSNINGTTNTGSLNQKLMVPCAIPAGQYTLFFVADGEAVIDEINETNNTVTAFINIAKGAHWNGSVNTDWEIAGNWSCNQIPDTTTDVIIDSGTVVIHSNTTIRSLSVKPGVALTVAPGASLTILH